MALEISLIVLTLVIIWLLVVSFYLARIYKFFRLLTKGNDNDTLLKVLEKILKEEKANKKDIRVLESSIAEISQEVVSHVQKTALVRFNPFKELGGDHSFVLSLLDGSNTGVLITGLHTRERTRVYVKKIKEGVSDLDLSNEEKRSLRLAQKQK